MRTIRTATIAAAALAALAACTPAATTPTPSPSAPHETPAPAFTGELPAVTPPGTELAVGESAIFEFRTVEFPDGLDGDAVLSDAAQLMRVAITSVEDSSPDNIPDRMMAAGWDRDEIDAKIVRYEVEHAGPLAISMERRTLVREFHVDGRNAFIVIQYEDFDECLDPVYYGTEFDDGGLIEGCFMVAYRTTHGMPNIDLGLWMTETEDNPLVWVIE